jgi:DNA-binding SARP family transcriptional activator/WD40 repeat protein
MEIGVLGPLLVHGDGAGLAPRDRVVLAALTMRPGELVAAEELADALWVSTPPATWAKVVQGSIMRLRKVLGSAAIETLPRGYRLVVAAHEVDAREFERMVRRAREQLTLGEPERASYTLAEALALWRGRALDDLDDWEAGRIEAGRLDALRCDAEELRIDAALRAGRHRQVLAEARALVEAAPLRERRWELLALAQYQAGRQGDALRTLREVKRVLLDELGLDSGHDLVALEEAILRQDPTLLAKVALAEPSISCPYFGLAPYDIDDAESYFGRDADITAGVQRLTSVGVLAVVGPSGSGKSSLVRAGIASTLRRDGMRVVVITPGPRPMDALTAVPSSSTPIVLVVDQCEEAVSLCEDPAERAEFFTALSARAESGLLVVALRADRLGDLAAFAGFARLVERGLYLLNPMSEQSLRATIEGPARQAGLALEPGLVELLIAEVTLERGALPLLSHAMRQTWELREGATLTVDGYRATGGIRDAVAQTAESLYEQVSPEQRPMLRDLLLRLVASGPGGEPVRRSIPRRLVAADAEHEELVELLVAARLVTSDDGVVELVHEAVVRAWPRLRGWLDEDSEGQRLLRHLTIVADTWNTMGRPDSELYRGVRLAQALEWRTQANPDLTPTEQAFLDAGRSLADAEEHTAARRARAEARINRRLRALLAGAAFLLIVAVVAGTLAVRQANRATEASRAADAGRVATQSQLTDRIDHSLRLALASLRLDASAGGGASLLAALARSPQLTSFVPAADQPFWHLDIDGDGRSVAVMDLAGRVRFYDTPGLQPAGMFDPHPPGWKTQVACVCNPVTFSPDGREVAVAIPTLAYPAVRLLDARSHRPVARQPGGLPRLAQPIDMDYSEDGRFLAVTFNGIQLDPLAQVASSAYVWDLDRPAAPLSHFRLVGDNTFAQLSPDGSLLYTVPGPGATAPPAVRVYDTQTGRQLTSLGPRGRLLTLSPDGSMLAYATADEVVLADSSTGRELRRMPGRLGDFGALEFSNDGEAIVFVADDRTAQVWETTSGRLRESLSLGDGTFADVRFSADGRQLFATVDDGLMAFDLDGSHRFIRRTTPPDAVQYPEGSTDRSVSPHGEALAVSVFDPHIKASKLHVRDMRTLRRVDLGMVTAGFSSIDTWRPDGQQLLVIDSDDQRVRVFDRTTGDVVRQRRFADGVGTLTYSRDGTLLLAETGAGVALLNAATLEQLTDPVRLPGRNLQGALLLPDGDRAVVFTGNEGRAPFDFTLTQGWALVDLRSETVIREGELTRPPESSALSPDGGRVAVAGAGGLEIIDLASGESRNSRDIGVEAESEGQQLAYSGDGRLLVSADSTGRVSLWHGRTADLVGTVAPSSEMSSPAFLADDHTVRIPSWDGAVYEWDTSLEHATDFACDVVRHGFTRSEWNQLLPNHAFEATCPAGVAD